MGLASVQIIPIVITSATSAREEGIAKPTASESAIRRRPARHTSLLSHPLLPHHRLLLFLHRHRHPPLQPHSSASRMSTIHHSTTLIRHLLSPLLTVRNSPSLLTQAPPDTSAVIVLPCMIYVSSLVSSTVPVVLPLPTHS